MQFHICCCILILIIYGILGIITFKDGRKSDVPSYITPWSPTQSWFIYGMLMLAWVANLMLSIEVMLAQGG